MDINATLKRLGRFNARSLGDSPHGRYGQLEFAVQPAWIGRVHLDGRGYDPGGVRWPLDWPEDADSSALYCAMNEDQSIFIFFWCCDLQAAKQRALRAYPGIEFM